MRLLAINHHYYREKAPKSAIYPTRPADFETRARELANSWTIGGARHIEEWLDDPARHESVCVLTFDDGLAEQMRAAEWLFSNGLTGLFFVSTATLVEPIVLDVHKLHLIRSMHSDNMVLEETRKRYGSMVARVDPKDALAEYRYDTDPDAAVLKYFINLVLSPDEREKFLSRLFSELVGDEEATSRRLYMDTEAVRWLAERNMLGTHSHRHLPLATLGEDVLRSEVEMSVDVIRSLTGVAPSGISYPYGGPAAVSREVADVCASAGLRFGFTMELGANDPQDHHLLLKRIDTVDAPRFLS